MNRRDVLKTSATLAAAAALPRPAAALPTLGTRIQDIPKRPLGKTGLTVTALGVGGYHLGIMKDKGVALRIVGEAIDAGVNFFDNAWEYNQGESEKRLGEALKGKRDKVVLMTKLCSHGRDKKFSLKMLDESLKRLKTDHLDLWQIHEVVYEDDPDLHYRPGGAIEALDAAKKAGKVRFVGFTGHKDPSLHLRMLQGGYAFDTVQMPLNCFDASFRSFETQVLPEVNRRGMGALGMKSMSGRGQPVLQGQVTPQEALRYAMSLPVATTISGMQSVEILRQNLAVARGFQPMSEAERQALKARVAEVAADGRYELYKTSKSYDAEEGRAQHGFPSPDELPL
jgi:aryl-alcohol dehydrogenase-like predicted oxidoreductase